MIAIRINQLKWLGLTALLMLLVVACSTTETAVSTEAAAVVEAVATTAVEQVATVASDEAATAVVEVAETAVAEAPTAVAEAAATVETIVAANTKLNLNTVTGDELLATIPDFGNRMVREFEEYRPYISIQQFRREIGKYVDDAQIAIYEQYVYVPVDVDNSDADTLMQIPGVDEAIAADLIAGRPYTSNEAFLTKLSDYLSGDALNAAAGYLAQQ